MDTEQLINVSQAVTHGNLRHVRNTKTTKQGIVLQIIGDQLTVDMGQATEVWAYMDCEDI